VRTVESGEQALDEIEHDAPDLLLLDVGMPGMDGLEVCRRVRRMPGGDLLPIVLVTGLSDITSRVRGLDAGADEFATKPIESEVLTARIRSLLRVKHVTDQLERTENVIFALARTVEARDAYTDRHLWRLAEYSQAMALALGCSTEEARYTWYGGVLHDIGKIGIDPNVLGKPGALTREEFEEVKRIRRSARRSSPPCASLPSWRPSCARTTNAGTARAIPQASRAWTFRSRPG
jgi:putative two-component system response regulator